MTKFNKSLFIFRRDLRMSDNTALNNALLRSDQVICTFFLDPRQGSLENKYFSAPAFSFMLNTLQELAAEFEKIHGYLNFIAGRPEEMIPILHQEMGIEAVFFNYDYTPFSKNRDALIKDACHKIGIKFLPSHDLALQEPGIVLREGSKPYSVYTYYARKAREFQVPKPYTSTASGLSSIRSVHDQRTLLNSLIVENSASFLLRGGRSEARHILKNLPSDQRYRAERDLPDANASTHLSAHLKFGTVSPREVYQALAIKDPQHLLISQLYWRDFFTQISCFYPSVYGLEYQEKMRAVKWQYDSPAFIAWTQGITGFPIVDAGMRELNQTGYMHNRVRMIVASFLTKNLRIDWRWGEKYFAQRLIDYDPALNNGNWQWAASTGCDAQPYFRIFNPWTQQKKFDADAKYIKRWVPELDKLTPKQIHDQTYMSQHALLEYPRPIVNHAETRILALDMFKAATGSFQLDPSDD